MSDLSFLVRGRSMDLAAMTARHALQDTLGLEDEVIDLLRDQLVLVAGIDAERSTEWTEAISAQQNWFNPNKHFGFVHSEEGQDVFLHQSHLLADDGSALQAGQKVRFHLHQAPKGPEAWNVELA